MWSIQIVRSYVSCLYLRLKYETLCLRFCVPIFKAFCVYFIAFERFKPTQFYSTSYQICMRVLSFIHIGFCLSVQCLGDTLCLRVRNVCIKRLSLPLTVCQVLAHFLSHLSENRVFFQTFLEITYYKNCFRHPFTLNQC